MFPGAGASGQPDMAELLKQAQAMQQQLLTAQDELARAEVTGSAGGGLVTATVSGTGEVLALTIAPEACDPSDTETLADLVLAAIRDATQAASDLQARTMSPLTQGLGGFGAGPGAGPGPGGPVPGGPGALPGSQG